MYRGRGSRYDRREGMHSQDLRGSGTVRLRQTDQPSRLSKNVLLLMPVLSVVLFFSPVSNLMTL